MKYAIIGGKGRMGRLFSEVLSSDGHEVMIIDKEDEISDANKAEIILLAAPLHAVPEILDEIEPKKDACLIDISSVMGNTDKIADLGCEAAFIHPLFGPETVSFKGQNFIIVPIKRGKRLHNFLDLLKQKQACLTYSDLEEHERMMATTQCLTHFSAFVTAKTAFDKTPESKITDFSTVLFRAQKSVMDRLFRQSPDMIADIELMNTEFLDMARDYRKNVDEAILMLEEGKRSDFIDEIERISSNLDQFSGGNGLVLPKKGMIHTDPEAIAVLGPKGTFTDHASRIYLKTTGEERKILYLESILDVVRHVERGDAHTGIIPFENSIHGTVTEALDMLYYNDLYIKSSIVLPIHHCAAVHPEIEVDVKEIDSILSHPHALSQCHGFIEKYYPDARIIPMQSTSEAFQQIRIAGLRRALAIGPMVAAELYDLKIISKDIEDVQNNKTRFLVVTREKEYDLDGTVVSLAVVPFHERQGILHSLLSIFNDFNINLTKIESRPLRDELGKYIFYIDLEGNFFDSRIQEALTKVKDTIGRTKIIGCYGVSHD